MTWRHVLFFYIKYVFFVLFWIISISSKRRGSHSEVPYKIGVFKNFAKFAGKHLCRILSYIKLHPGGLQFYQKKTPAQVLFCKICKIIKSTYFLEHLRTAASENGSIKSNNTVRSLPNAWFFSVQKSFLVIVNIRIKKIMSCQFLFCVSN